MRLVDRFVADERGLETVEYAIIAGLIVAGLVAIVVALGGWVKTSYSNIQTTMPGA